MSAIINSSPNNLLNLNKLNCFLRSTWERLIRIGYFVWKILWLFLGIGSDVRCLLTCELIVFNWLPYQDEQLYTEITVYTWKCIFILIFFVFAQVLSVLWIFYAETYFLKKNLYNIFLFQKSTTYRKK